MCMGKDAHVCVCDNYLVCVDVSAEIFFCLSSEKSFLCDQTGTVIKICVSRCVTENVSCKPASKARTLHLPSHASGHQSRIKATLQETLFSGNIDSLLEMCKLTHGNGLASHFLSDALSGLVNSSLRCDSLRSVKTQHLFPRLTTVGVQSLHVASCTLSGILFPAGVQDADVIWLQTFNRKQHCVPGVLPTCQGKRM